MKRSLYMSQLKEEACPEWPDALRKGAADLLALLERERTVAFSLFRHAGWLCAYRETAGEEARFEWPERFRGLLLTWPGEAEPRFAVEMADVYHDGVPADEASWRGGRTVAERAGALAAIKSDQLASYVYYHFQKQEEDPSSFNKTYIIGAYGGLLFSYQELPEAPAVDKPGKPGYRMDADWQALMRPHFRPWDDAAPGEELWRRMELAADLDALRSMANQ